MHGQYLKLRYGRFLLNPFSVLPFYDLQQGWPQRGLGKLFVKIKISVSTHTRLAVRGVLKTFHERKNTHN
jgi:hypothetical protein